MTKKKKRQNNQQPITPVLEQFDKSLLKIHYKLAETTAKLNQMEKQLNRIEQWINQIYLHLDRIDRRTKLLVEYIKYKEENNLRNKIRKLLGKHPIIRLS